ncbi:hypothetical protein HZS_6641 [Henneguya salminicola]|nr:hypothetical protein HZS_6641 [Henneguya salminicola]
MAFRTILLLLMWVKPDFCGKYETPQFEKISELSENMEERQYLKSTWIVAPNTENSYFASNSLFYHLFNYIRGQNSEKLKIDMTVPVLTKYDRNMLTDMRFFLSNDISKKWPEPIDSTLKFVNIPEITFYVINYSGYSNVHIEKEKLKELIQVLKEKNLSDTVDESSYYMAVYDQPTKIFARHNEIWLEKKSQT